MFQLTLGHVHETVGRIGNVSINFVSISRHDNCKNHKDTICVFTTIIIIVHPNYVSVNFSFWRKRTVDWNIIWVHDYYNSCKDTNCFLWFLQLSCRDIDQQLIETCCVWPKVNWNMIWVHDYCHYRKGKNHIFSCLQLKKRSYKSNNNPAPILCFR